MSSPAMDLKYRLDNDVSFNKGSFVFKVSYEPDVPEECVTLYDYAGENREYMLGGVDIEKPAVQFRCRSNDYATGYDFLRSIADYFRSATLEFVNADSSYSYWGFSQQNDITFLERDDANRSIFVLNFYLKRCKL
jgi:hypothetical protein